MSARYIIGDVFDVLATLEPASVDLIVTSPPFLALRSYLPADHPDKARELGSEATPGAFIDTMLDVVEACGRVLAPHGSLVFELGDTYAGGGGSPFGGDQRGTERYDDGRIYVGDRARSLPSGWPLDKSKVLIPQLFAIAIAYGFNPLTGRQTEKWRVRNTVAWARPNPPVGRDGDKFRPATSFLTVACKARDRYWDGDAVRVAFQESTLKQHGPEAVARRGGRGSSHGEKFPLSRGGGMTEGALTNAGAPLLDYWVIPIEPYAGAHYATYPRNLVVPLVKSMCPQRVCRVCGEPSRRMTAPVHDTEHNARQRSVGTSRGWNESRGDGGSGPYVIAEYETLGWSDCGHDSYRSGLILDPFAGSGTTLQVASGHGLDSIGIDLDARNAELARDRVGGLFLEIETVEVADGS